MEKSNQDSTRLAIAGGNPVRSKALPPWPEYSSKELDAAEHLLRSGKVNYWTGDECRYLESEFAEYHGVAYGIALANGTLALELALRILGIGPGDEVVVTPRSYFASASAIAMIGATPVFADVDLNSQNTTIETLRAKLSPRTRALLVVHLAGWPCEMPAIMEIARKHDLLVIEDCAQAHGARYNGQLVGTFGHVGAFSFCQDKIISTAGEGGMLITNDEELWKAAWSFKDHGKSWDRVNLDDHPPGFRWLHVSFGSNYRMTEIQGAIGRIQLRKLNDWVNQRRQNAAGLAEALSDITALRIPRPSDKEYHAYYKFYAFVKPEKLNPGWSRNRILCALEAEGVPGWSGTCPEIYREKAFESECYPVLPNARELGETSIMLPVHPTLKSQDIEDISLAVRKVFAVACK